jgi:hypothetical protein
MERNVEMGDEKMMAGLIKNQMKAYARRRLLHFSGFSRSGGFCFPYSEAAK